MATFVSTDITTTYTLTSAQDLVLLPGVTISAAGMGITTPAGTNSGHKLAIYGGVFATSTALALTRSGSNFVPFVNDVVIGSAGEVLSLDSDGLSTNSDFFTLQNLGTIATMGSGTADHGLELFANADITNSGTITAANGDGIRLAPTASVDSTGPQMLNNSGSIHGGSNGITYAGMWLNGINSGEISGNGLGIVVSGATGLMTFTNTGTIIGGSGRAVQSAAGHDLFQNSGLVVGNVELGGGHDVYIATLGGAVLGRISGGEGNDTLTGSFAEDDVYGNNGHDLLAGRRGDDLLVGGGGNDTLRGGAGEDVLNGGLGTERLFGGRDADSFVWAKASDSAVGLGRDVVADFESGLDVLDLEAVVPGTIAFLGNGSFTGGGAELRYFAQGAGLIVEVDTDGNGTGDMQIELKRIVSILESDVLL